MKQFKTFKPVHQVIFSSGALAGLGDILEERRSNNKYVVFVIDHFFKESALLEKIPITSSDICFFADTTNEPKTETIDIHVEAVLQQKNTLPSVVIGIGGGATLDIAKALSIMLVNPGKTHMYQGWDLVKNPAVYKIGIPTISGTGSEVSRTTVLTGPIKKQGINSDWSLFDFAILDPNLLATVPKEQRFYTGMDCYIHCVESLCGTFINEFSRAFASKALELCNTVFLSDGTDADLMVASYMGGSAIVYSEVGICHALSYGLSYAFGIHHGMANCIVFNHLDEYYPDHMADYREMLLRNQVELPRKPGGNVDKKTLEKMTDITLLMEKPLYNACGQNWQSIVTKEKIKELYSKILEI